MEKYYIFFKYNEEISPIPLEDTEDNKMLFYRILNNMIRKNDEFKYLAQLVAIRNEKGEFFVVHDDYKYEMMDYYLLERIDNVKPII